MPKLKLQMNVKAQMTNGEEELAEMVNTGSPMPRNHLIRL